MVLRDKFLVGEQVSSARICPVCNQQALQFDQKSGRIRCSNCGFEEVIPVMKK
jgi:hypothetical protein